MGFGKLYFPECTKSATLINAPWVFSKIWALISGFLTEVMRNKVSIIGSDWKSGKFQEASVSGVKDESRVRRGAKGEFF